jgi:hypothetical protein
VHPDVLISTRLSLPDRALVHEGLSYRRPVGRFDCSENGSRLATAALGGPRCDSRSGGGHPAYGVLPGNDLADHADAAVSAAVLIYRRVAERFDGALRIGIGINRVW